MIDVVCESESLYANDVGGGITRFEMSCATPSDD
tara:strand:- start:534 stop:635 length:102 start_codon:yes stop_codon:yes gene_type:complete